MPVLSPRSGLLRRFHGDVSGNALAIMAAAILPMTAAVGGAIDISRDYMAKSRLQQACDAGVLAGRKKQGGTTFGSDAMDEAKTYFAINFPDGTYSAKDVQFNATSNTTNEVNGTASAFIPSTIGAVVGYKGQKLDVACSAKLDLTNTDVMFVLDVTGSMAESAGSTTKIVALRKAVVDFADVLEQARRTDTQVRYGFVAYNTTVNVGGLLMARDPSLIDTRHDYQSREWIDQPYVFNTNSSGCSGQKGRYNSGRGECTVDGFYHHAKLTFDVGAYARGLLFTNPASRTRNLLSWPGCIEERSTVAGSKFSGITADMWDLNMDADSGGGQDQRQFRPMLDALYYRNSGSTDDYFLEGTSDSTKITFSCPTAKGQLVKTMNSSEITSYVNTLQPNGSTYHDIGMIWGLRLLSPTGLWSAQNTASPNGLPISRNIIFMTDGLMSTQDTDYSAYGLERHDERVGGGVHNAGALGDLHSARFLAVCALAKSQYNVRVWTVAFGTPLSSTKLVECADPGRSFQADNAEELNDTFRRIATRIADLRLEQ